MIHIWPGYNTQPCIYAITCNPTYRPLSCKRIFSCSLNRDDLLAFAATIVVRVIYGWFLVVVVVAVRSVAAICSEWWCMVVVAGLMVVVSITG